MELGAGGAAGPRQRDGAEPVRLLFLLLGGGGGGGSGWAWSPGGGGEGGAGTGTETGPEPDYEGLPRGSAASTHMLAGAVAGVLEHSLMYPVDCVKWIMVTMSCCKENGACQFVLAKANSKM
uniref:Uncharacterized protein n=1 Tax=Sphaerodactylus townsendi TaxID=933632 RepID=A0ACB8FA14_9SAUR